MFVNACNLFEIQKMSETAFLKDSEVLEFIPDQYKIKRICKKAVIDYLFMMEFVPECDKIQKVCEKAVPRR